MIGLNKSIRLGLVVAAAILAGFGGVAALSRGIEFVVAADIHPTITEPLDGYNPQRAGVNRSAAQTPGIYLPAGEILGEYTTKFTAEPRSRNENIIHAADSIHGIVLAPGEVFSYNDAIGPTTKQNGYKRARIFIRGKKAYGYGGGVCQVSSTLYNAAVVADMQILERHSHSLPVEYVPKGKDAATSYGGLDFKFKNSRSYPIEIETLVTDNSLTVQILSAE